MDQRESIGISAVPAERDSIAHITGLIRSVWTWGRRIVLGALILAGAVILLEAVHLHSMLSTVHPWLAWAVSGILLGLLAGVIGWMGWRWFSVPRVVAPPELPPPEAGWTPRQTRSYLSFALRFLERQRRNPALPVNSRDRIDELIRSIKSEGHGDKAAVVVERVERAIDEALEPIDRKARKEVWQSASHVAVLTAINPSAMLDVLITLLRNLELMARLSKLYYGRPGIFGTLYIMRDVMAVAATAGVVERVAESAGTVAAEMMGSWTARLAGPVGQGITNGLLTVRLGDAAVVRCRSLRSRRVGIKPWSATTWREMARRLSSKISEHVAPDIALAFRRASRPRTEQPMRLAAGWIRGMWRGPDEQRADASPEEGVDEPVVLDE